jgi:dienelactone hydrolase
MPSGNKWQDTVRLRWFMAEGVAEGATAPAVILVHSLHPDLPVATMLARGLSKQGIQSFILELPGYGGRVGPDRQLTGATALIHGRQSITDCRRALDAVAVLPGVDPDNISVQGTSLGSFIATAASGLDQPFAYSFLLLAGGDGVDILERGDKDAFHVRGALQHYGYHGEKLRTLIEPMEPLMLAHRLNQQRTWMFNAEQDRVIPKANADMLAKAIGLTEDHHLWMPGNHYTSFALLPGVLGKMTQVIEGQAQGD